MYIYKKTTTDHSRHASRAAAPHAGFLYGNIFLFARVYIIQLGRDPIPPPIKVCYNSPSAGWRLPSQVLRRCGTMIIPMIDTVATGQNINRMRINAGMTVRDMQNVFGFATPQAIYKWIHGTAMPTIDNMVILAAMFGVTLDDIIAVDTIDVKCG